MRKFFLYGQDEQFIRQFSVYENITMRKLVQSMIEWTWDGVELCHIQDRRQGKRYIRYVANVYMRDDCVVVDVYANNTARLPKGRHIFKCDQLPKRYGKPCVKEVY